MLCFYDYSSRLVDENYEPLINNIIDQSEYYFTNLFIFEAAIKIIGMGFFIEKRSYLRDWWNFCDFLIVLAGFLSNFLFVNVFVVIVFFNFFVIYNFFLSLKIFIS